MKRTVSRLYLALVLLIGFVSALQAEDSSVRTMSEKSKIVLEVYLDKAEKELTDSAWFTLANQGKLSATNSFESMIVHMSDNSIIDAGRAEFSSELDTFLQERYRAWLIRRFIETKNKELDHSSFTLSLDEANKDYLYEQDADGSILKDSNGLVLTKNSESLQEDTDLWLSSVTKAKDTLLKGFSDLFINSNSELLNVFKGRSEDFALLEAEFEVSFSTQKKNYERMIENVFLQAQNRFLSLRTFDSNSFKKKSDETQAALVAERLIDQTTKQADESIKKVSELISDKLENPDALIEIDEKDWLESFKLSFNAGLDKWQNAEKEFLSQRSLWEQNNAKAYNEGEEAWALAFTNLKNKKEQWQLEIRTVLDKGSISWKNKRASLENAIKEAKKEFEDGITAREESIAQRIDGVVTLFKQTQDLSETARQNGLYWYKRLNVEEQNAEDYTFENLNKVSLENYDALHNSLIIVIQKYKNIEQIKINAQEAYANELASKADEVKKIQDEIDALEAQTEPEGENVSEVEINEFILYKTKQLALLNKEKDDLLSESRRLLEEQNIAEKNWNDVLVTYNALNSIISELNSKKEYLLSQLNINLTNENIGETFTVWVNELSNIDQNASLSAKRITENMVLYNEAAFWLQKRVVYRQSLSEIRQMMADTFASTVADSKETDPLLSVLVNDASDTFSLDIYQVELLKAKALKEYWKKRLDCAQAVYDYAINTSAGKETEAELKIEMTELLKAMENANISYANSISSMEALNVGVKSNTEQIELAKTNMQKALQVLEKSENEYTQLLALKNNKNPDYYIDKLRSASDNFFRLKNTKDKRMAEYLAASKDYALAVFLDSGNKYLKELVNGNIETRSLSYNELVALAELNNYNENGFSTEITEILTTNIADSNFLLFCDKIKLKNTELQYGVIEEKYIAYKNAVENDVGNKGYLYEELISLLRLRSKALFAESEKRRSEIALFSNVTEEALFSELGLNYNADESITNQLDKKVSAEKFTFLKDKTSVLENAIEKCLTIIENATDDKDILERGFSKVIASEKAYIESCVEEAFLNEYRKCLNVSKNCANDFLQELQNKKNALSCFADILSNQKALGLTNSSDIAEAVYKVQDTRIREIIISYGNGNVFNASVGNFLALLDTGLSSKYTKLIELVKLYELNAPSLVLSREKKQKEALHSFIQNHGLGIENQEKEIRLFSIEDWVTKFKSNEDLGTYEKMLTKFKSMQRSFIKEQNNLDFADAANLRSHLQNLYDFASSYAAVTFSVDKDKIKLEVEQAVENIKKAQKDQSERNSLIQEAMQSNGLGSAYRLYAKLIQEVNDTEKLTITDLMQGIRMQISIEVAGLIEIEENAENSAKDKIDELYKSFGFSTDEVTEIITNALRIAQNIKDLNSIIIPETNELYKEYVTSERLSVIESLSKQSFLSTELIKYAEFKKLFENKNFTLESTKKEYVDFVMSLNESDKLFIKDCRDEALYYDELIQSNFINFSNYAQSFFILTINNENSETAEEEKAEALLNLNTEIEEIVLSHANIDYSKIDELKNILFMDLEALLNSKDPKITFSNDISIILERIQSFILAQKQVIDKKEECFNVPIKNFAKQIQSSIEAITNEDFDVFSDFAKNTLKITLLREIKNANYTLEDFQLDSCLGIDANSLDINQDVDVFLSSINLLSIELQDKAIAYYAKNQAIETNGFIDETLLQRLSPRDREEIEKFASVQRILKDEYQGIIRSEGENQGRYRDFLSITEINMLSYMHTYYDEKQFAFLSDGTCSYLDNLCSYYTAFTEYAKNNILNYQNSLYDTINNTISDNEVVSNFSQQYINAVNEDKNASNYRMGFDLVLTNEALSKTELTDASSLTSDIIVLNSDNSIQNMNIVYAKYENAENEEAVKLRNYLLEGMSKFQSFANNFEKNINETSSNNSENMLRNYSNSLVKLKDDYIWNDLSYGFEINSKKNEFQKIQSEMTMAEALFNSCKQEINNQYKNYLFLKGDTKNLDSKLLEKKSLIAQNQEVYKKTNDRYLLAIKEHQQFVDTYNCAYEDVQKNFNLYSNARQNYLTKESIYNYAQNPYSKARNTDLDLQSPLEDLTDIRSQFEATSSSLQMLTELVEANAKGRAELTSVATLYKEKYAQYLVLKEIQYTYNATLSKQEEAERNGKMEYKKALAELGNTDSFVIGQDESMYNAFLKRLTWSKDLVNNKLDLKVNLNQDESGLVCLGTESKNTNVNYYEDLKALFIVEEGKELSPIQELFNDWTLSFASYQSKIKNESGNNLAKWMLASEYLSKLAGENISYFGVLSETIPEPKTPIETAKTKIMSTYDASTKSAFDEIYKDPEQKVLFEQFMAFKALGLLDDSFNKLLKNSASMEFNTLAKSILLDQASLFARQASALGVLAAAYTSMSIVLFFVPGAQVIATLYGIQAGIFAYGSIDSSIQSSALYTLNQNNSGSYIVNNQNNYETQKQICTDLFSNVAKAKADWDTEALMLKNMKGGGDLKLSIDEIVKGVESSYTDKNQILSEENKKLLQTYYQTINGTNSAKTTISDALNYIELNIKDKIEEEEKNIRERLQEQSDLDKSNIPLYKKAEAEYAEALKKEYNAQSVLDDFHKKNTNIESSELSAELLRLNNLLTNAKSESLNMKNALQLSINTAWQNPSISELQLIKNRFLDYFSFTNDTVSSNSGVEMGELESFANAGNIIKELMSYRMKNLREIRIDELTNNLIDLDERESAWNTTTLGFMKTGLREWANAERTIAQNYKAFQDNFVSDYENKANQWNSMYLGFEDNKKAWADKAVIAASKVQSATYLDSMTDDVTMAVASLKSFVVGNVNIKSNAEIIQDVNDVINNPFLQDIIKKMRSSVSALDNLKALVRRGVRKENANTDVSLKIDDLARKTREETSIHSFKLLAAQAREQLEAEKKGLEEGIVSSNTSFVENLDQTFMAYNFNRTGSSGWSRKAIVGSTVLGIVTEAQTLPAYTRFRESVEITFNLSDADLDGLSGEGIAGAIKVEEEKISEKQKELFGEEAAYSMYNTKDEERSYTDSNATEARINELFTAEQNRVGFLLAPFVNRDSFKAQATVTKTDKQVMRGKFGEHTGYSAILSTSPDTSKSYGENVVLQGKGELGKIIGLYQYYLIREGKGMQEINMPTYDKRMWNDDDSIIKAPTIKGIVDMGVSIGAMTVPGGPLVAAALNLADDALFDLAGVAGGYADAGSTGFNFLKKAASSFASIGIGELFKPLTTAVASIEGMNGVFARAGSGFAQQVASNTSSGLINSFELNETGNLGFNANNFTNSVYGIGALSSYLGSAAGTITSGALGEWNLKDANGTKLSQNTFNTKSIGQFNLVSANLINAGIQYGMTGSTTVNLLNFDMFGLSSGEEGKKTLLSSGLLELNIGRNGISSRIGAGGIDTSIGLISGSMSGFIDTMKISGAKLSYMTGDDKGISTLNAINGLGYSGNTKNYELAKAIWDGTVQINYSDIGLNNLGEFDIHKNNLITLSNKLKGNGLDQASKLAAVISHEGNHLDGNRIEYDAYKRGSDTYASITKAWNLTGDKSLIDSMQAAMKDGRNKVANTGEKDYFYFKLDGTIEDTVDKKFYREIIDGNGKSKKEEIGSFECGHSQALFQALGPELAKKMLGGTKDSISDYSDDELKTILGWDDNQIKKSRKAESGMPFTSMISGDQLEKLQGYKLLVMNNLVYDDNQGKWTGSLKIPGLEKGEKLGVAKIGNAYNFFTAGMNVTRESDAFEVWKNGVRTQDYDVMDNTDISFWKRDLTTQMVENYAPDYAFTSVDKSDGNYAGTANQSVFSNWAIYQGNTIVSSDFYMHLTGASNWVSETFNINNVGVFTDATILSGEKLAKNGMRENYSESRWLFHPFSKEAYSEGCFGPLGSNIDLPNEVSWNNINNNNTGTYKFNQILNKIYGWNIYNGYEFKVYMGGKVKP